MVVSREILTLPHCQKKKCRIPSIIVSSSCYEGSPNTNLPREAISALSTHGILPDITCELLSAQGSLPTTSLSLPHRG